MQPAEQQAILTVALLAAFADGDKHDRQRDEIKRIAQSLTGDAGAPQLMQLYQDVLLKRVDLTSTLARITDPGHRQLAYEMAVCVCDADGVASDKEKAFLKQLRDALQLTAAATSDVEREADAVAAAPLAAGIPVAVAAQVITPELAGAASNATPTAATDAELDQTILRYSILNGALELLPQSWATMAIIPLQMKLVYRIGQSHGVELDKGHIKEFIATAGVGLTSQYLEQFGRKLLGGLLGSVAGGIGRGVGRAASGVAFSFATTYALGHLARRYYAGGRQMNTSLLRETYQSLLGSAKQLQGNYTGEIQQQARTLDMAKIMSMIKG